ncbi:hypothetical protein I204_02373 [Kwoniella mangroviensis CBS 8886]|uniref:hypothetical protein n=1 Tax=Kwoniella mangroviensis CBS 8507 TaxID=1296122 RepID=UPI00080CD2C3|nr:hypothetical protein I204_02373 [Kwoniella mangroviensis CBS 8886]
MSTTASKDNTDSNTQSTTDGASQGAVPERQDTGASTGNLTFEPGNISHAPTWGTKYSEVRDDPGPDNWAAQHQVQQQQQQQDPPPQPQQQQQQGEENNVQGGNN